MRPGAIRSPKIAEQPASFAGLAGWAKAEKRPPRKRGGGVAASSMQSATTEAERRGGSGDWEGARPLVFVAAYARLHELVYGLAPAELGPQERKVAACAAARMLKREFDGDAAAMAVFVQWAWKREQGREKWRRANGRQGFRMTWRLLFGGAILTDHRLEQLRSKSR